MSMGSQEGLWGGGGPWPWGARRDSGVGVRLSGTRADSESMAQGWSTVGLTEGPA